MRKRESTQLLTIKLKVIAKTLLLNAHESITRKRTSERCCSSSLRNPNFDFPSSGVKRVKSCGLLRLNLLLLFPFSLPSPALIGNLK